MKDNKSGYNDIDRDDEYYKKTWAETIDKAFTQTVFAPYPALVCKELVNGHRQWAPYNGREYDKGKYEMVENKWDHEHCSICNFKITEGNTYWFNKNRIRLLCDECYEYYKKS
ncbi:MAG: hypothetical protein ACYDEX_21990 [Mobilitalea sp.]